MNTADLGLAGLAVRAVVADRGGAGVELAQGVPGDDPVEVGVAQRADARPSSGPDEQLGRRRRDRR